MGSTGPRSEPNDRSRAGHYAECALGRMLLALVSCGFLLNRLPAPGSVLLVLCVWSDALAGWLGRRRGWIKGPFDVQMEGFSDALCFVITPALLVASVVNYRLLPMLILPVFIVSGVWRLARFNVEGLVRNGYVGLPVTYNGYWMPAAVAIEQHWRGIPDTVWYGLVLGVISVLMTSRRFVTPEL
jgi:phosphatidylserine synthase